MTVFDTLGDTDLRLLGSLVAGGIAVLFGVTLGTVLERRRALARLAVALAPSDPEVEATETWPKVPVRATWSTETRQFSALLALGVVALAVGAGAGVALAVNAEVVVPMVAGLLPVEPVPVAEDRGPPAAR